MRQGLTATSQRTVKEFFLADINSVPAAGKRETITSKKIKMQRRYLCDSMVNLYDKFNAEYPELKVSCTSFTRLRPFHVVHRAVNQRDTVKCKIHENAELKAAKLHGIGLLKSKDIYVILKDITCSTHNRDCMYQKCPLCSDKLKTLYNEVTADHSDIVTISYCEWQSKKEEQTTSSGAKITVRINFKAQLLDTIDSLRSKFEQDLKALMPHQYRIFHQYMAIAQAKRELTAKECVLQIDFSENYACKAGTEIQSMHFGASRNQVTLHTCMQLLSNHVVQSM